MDETVEEEDDDPLCNGVSIVEESDDAETMANEILSAVGMELAV